MGFFNQYSNNSIGAPFLFGSPFGFNYMQNIHPSNLPPINFDYYKGRPLVENATMQPQLQNINNFPQLQNTQISNPSVTNMPNQNQANDFYSPQTDEAKLLNMRFILETAKNEQGFIGKTIDGIKGLTGLGISSKKCEKCIESAKNGQMSISEAYKTVSNYSSAQRSGVNLLISILAGGLSLFATKGKINNFGNILTAIGVGASVKAGVKALDRGTNNIDNDALNLKNIAKDGISGALNGVTTNVVIGANGISNMKTSTGILTGTRYGGLMLGITGAIMGASDYILESTFEEKEKFSIGNLFKNSLKSGLFVGSIGGVIGGIKSFLNARRAPNNNVPINPSLPLNT